MLGNLCRWLSVPARVSGAQNAVGTGVLGGMVTATVLAIFFVPVFFVVVRRRFSRKSEDNIEHSRRQNIADLLTVDKAAQAALLQIIKYAYC